MIFGFINAVATSPVPPSPGSLVGFNPQPDPPAVIPLLLPAVQRVREVPVRLIAPTG